MLTKSRVVAFIVTPLITAGATVGTSWLAKHFPGLPKFDPTQVTAEALAVGGIAGGACLKWLHGNSLWERESPYIEKYAKDADKVIETADPGVTAKIENAGEAAAEAEVKKVVALVPAAPAEAWPADAPAPEATPPAPIPTPATSEPDAAA